MRPASVLARIAVGTGILLGVPAGCARSAPDTEPAPAAGGGEPTNAVVTADDIRQNPSQSLVQIIQSKCASCTVHMTPDGRISIRVRGRGTIQGDGEPLYVIDGVPIEPGPGGALLGVNPHDIEKIEILTDPASISMYGSRGANGVIVVTTKGPPPPRR